MKYPSQQLSCNEANIFETKSECTAELQVGERAKDTFDFQVDQSDRLDGLWVHFTKPQDVASRGTTLTHASIIFSLDKEYLYRRTVLVQCKQVQHTVAFASAKMPRLTLAPGLNIESFEF
jgi:hypothetical protein